MGEHAQHLAPDRRSTRRFKTRAAAGMCLQSLASPVCSRATSAGSSPRGSTSPTLCAGLLRRALPALGSWERRVALRHQRRQQRRQPSRPPWRPPRPCRRRWMRREGLARHLCRQRPLHALTASSTKRLVGPCARCRGGLRKRQDAGLWTAQARRVRPVPGLRHVPRSPAWSPALRPFCEGLGRASASPGSRELRALGGCAHALLVGRAARVAQGAPGAGCIARAPHTGSCALRTPGSQEGASSVSDFEQRWAGAGFDQPVWCRAALSVIRFGEDQRERDRVPMGVLACRGRFGDGPSDGRGGWQISCKARVVCSRLRTAPTDLFGVNAFNWAWAHMCRIGRTLIDIG